MRLPRLPGSGRDGWVAFILREDHRLRQGWRILFFLLAWFLLGPLLVAVPLGLLFPGREAPAWIAPLLGGVATLLVSWGFLTLEDRPLASLGLWVNRGWLRHLLFGLLLGLLLVALPALLLASLGAIHWRPTEARALPLLATGLLIAGARAFSQEIFARGYVFQRLAAGLGRWPAQGLVALGFLLIHGLIPGAFGLARLLDLTALVLMSLLLGEAFLRTRSLALPLGLNAGWTFAQATLLGFSTGGQNTPGLYLPTANPAFSRWLTGGASGMEASLPGMLATATTLLVLLLLGRRQNRFKDPDWDEPSRIM